MKQFLIILPVCCLAPAATWGQDGAAAAPGPEPLQPVEAPQASDQSALSESLEKILAKEGISMSGFFRSRFLHASIGGEGAVEGRRSEETVEFTSVDFDIRARPNTAAQGRLVFRMYQDWRNYFSDIANPIFTRWISLDGEVAGMFRYNAGDFRQRYSPLTLWTPEAVPFYEPVIFSQEREAAMAEEFLGSNDRLLQGVNLNFDAAVVPVFDEFHLNLLGSRLRNVETNIQGGNKVTARVEAANAEKFLGGINLDTRFMQGLTLGATYMKIADKEGTYAGRGKADTAVQNTGILALRAGARLDSLLDTRNWGAGAHVEWARSSDDTAWYQITGVDTAFTDSGIAATALLLGLDGSWSPTPGIDIGIELDYLRNEPEYRNELAQTPSFIGERVLNIENDSNLIKTNDVRAVHYSTFDALYRHVFKFTPSERTNMWHKAPFEKNSYTNAILTQSELGTVARTGLDTSLQLIMPLGPATPNRTGPRLRAKAGLMEGNVELRAMWSALEELESLSDGAPKTSYSELGAGGRVRVGGLLGWSRRLDASGGWRRSGAERAAYAVPGAVGVTAPSAAVDNDFIALGLEAGIWKRTTLMAGLQRVDTRVGMADSTANRVETLYAAGVEYRIGPGAYGKLSIGRLGVDYEGNDDDFSQLLTDLGLRVMF